MENMYSQFEIILVIWDIQATCETYGTVTDTANVIRTQKGKH
jgi:hypothetical protein